MAQYGRALAIAICAVWAAGCGAASPENDSKPAAPLATVPVPAAAPAQLAHVEPDDAETCASKSSDWIGAAGGQFELVPAVYDDIAKLEAEFSPLIFLDFDNSIYWDDEVVDLPGLESRVLASGDAHVAVTWNRLTRRGQAYKVIRILNEAGKTPTVLLFSGNVLGDGPNC